MALGAAHLFVAGITNAVQSFLSMANFGCRLLIFSVARTAAFRVMTRSTVDAVLVRVVLVKERDNCSAAVRRVPDFFIRLNQSRKAASRPCRQRRFRHDFLTFLYVTDIALRVVTPILVATETLTVVRAFESGLFEVFVGDVRGVAVLASRDAAHFLKVVAVLASAVHGRHFRMKSVRELNGPVFFFNFVNQNLIGTHLDVFGGGPWTRTRSQTRIVERRCAANVTFTATVG